MFDNLKADIRRYTVLSKRPGWYCLLATFGLWAMAEYRYSHWVDRKLSNRVLRKMLKAFGFVWKRIILVATGICIDHKAEIGKGLFIAHFGCIFIAGGVKMGEKCNISQGVTIGWGGRGPNKGCPTLGERVYVGAGAKIIGKITIGSNVAVGANAVVTKDVPTNAVVVGIPAKIINYKGSSDFIDWHND
jgi:serine O-acetyltransferase